MNTEGNVTKLSTPIAELHVKAIAMERCLVDVLRLTATTT
jgi:hypothetical protein